MPEPSVLDHKPTAESQRIVTTEKVGSVQFQKCVIGDATLYCGDSRELLRAGVYLSPLYDNPAPTPEFHREAWRLYCSIAEYAAIAAPLIVSATEELSIGYLTEGKSSPPCRNSLNQGAKNDHT